MSIIHRVVAALVTVLLSATLVLAHGYKLGNLDIHHPWSKAMLPGAKVAGGFMKITNNGADADRLVSITSSAAPMIQLHEMKVENDVMTMAEVPGGIEIAPGATVELKPGALHVMFMNVPTPFKEGDKIKATLNFEKAGSIDVEFNVSAPNGKEEMKHEHKHAASADMQQPDDAQMAIPMVMKALFETADNPLSVEPVVVSGDYAVAGWSQAGKGGRALLKKGENGWAIHMCSGASLKDAAELVKVGMSEADASAIAAGIAAEEAKLGAEKIALYDSFEGTMMIGGEDDAHKHHHHKG